MATSRQAISVEYKLNEPWEELMSINWKHWLERWDAQQTRYLPEREARFNAMLDVLEFTLSGNLAALDLACGPGAISQRLLKRFPQAQCIAVDLDPVLLAMGQNVLGDANGRLRWVEANLMDGDWVEKLNVTQVDAVLSTTALHWLPGPDLVRVYSQLGQLVRPGGIFLNGDHLPFGAHLPTFSKIAQAWEDRIQHQAFEQRGGENWKAWWDALEQEPDAKPLLAERRRRFGWYENYMATPGYKMTGLDLHLAALREAGFREAGTIWQRGDNQIALAVR
jgi:SAM-dependent methyltransferase